MVTYMFRYPPITDPSYQLGVGAGGFVSFSINATGGVFKFHGGGKTDIMQANIKPRTTK
jgi:hypothetical protein